MRRLGSMVQMGCAQLLSCDEGPGRGEYFLEFRLGGGFIFEVAFDCGMNMSNWKFKGMPLRWVHLTLLPDGRFIKQLTKICCLRPVI